MENLRIIQARQSLKVFIKKNILKQHDYIGLGLISKTDVKVDTKLLFNDLLSPSIMYPCPLSGII